MALKEYGLTPEAQRKLAEFYKLKARHTKEGDFMGWWSDAKLEENKKMYQYLEEQELKLLYNGKEL